MYLYIMGMCSKYFIQRIFWKKSFNYHCIFVIWSWVSAKLMAYYVSPPKWFVITSNSICKKMQSSFFPSRPSLSPWFCVFINGISSILPVTQPRNLESSFVCFTFHPSLCNSFYVFPPFHLHCHHLFSGPFNDFYHKSLIGLYSFSLLLNWSILKN